MREPKRRQTIKEWELETGIKVIDPKGFTNWNGKSRLLTNRYTKEQFRKGLEKSIITVKTQKGLDFLQGLEAEDDYWRSWVKSKNQREANNDYSKSKQKRNY